jgi:GntR family transcriptional regulator/MocR family aminotransferase
VLPLASADRDGVVLYVGTLSKVLAPGLRCGYVVAPPPVREALVGLRFDVDRQGDRVGERALAELMEDGELQRHFWRMRRVYQARRDHFVHDVKERLGRWLELSVPPGGMGLWAKVDRSLPVGAWLDEATSRGVLFQPGKLFTWGNRDAPYVRLGYGAHSERDLTTGVTRLVDAARSVLRI